ncbi:MAG: tetraacyldisaccharide 4'-kinase [Planctomycetaceae bacterium]|nr:tetraacyldisaccharide 4'-kinase [Planctomycetaceae bacterium]
MDHRSIMSGKRGDPIAMVVRVVLRMASVPYGIVVRRRNHNYDRQVADIQRCDVPVISVGNLTTGGTGKTPIVCLLAKRLRERGLRVAIVSRGYGRGDADANDEAMELHARLPDVPHIQNPDRVAAAQVAVEELEAQIILMDDGFQHRRLHRDLDIVVIDATCPFGFGYQLPRGLLRESMDSLSRADAVLITRCQAVDPTAIESIRQTISTYNAEVPILASNHTPIGLLEYPETNLPLKNINQQKVGVLSAIGNSDAFEHTVRQCGATVQSARHLPDHDPYAPETVASLRDWAKQLGNEIAYIVCTHKDLVKLQTDRLGGKHLVALQIDLTLQNDANEFDEMLDRIADQSFTASLNEESVNEESLAQTDTDRSESE